MIGIIIVIYRPNGRIVNSIQNIICDISKERQLSLFLVDNTPRQYIRYNFINGRNTIYISNGENKGIALAQNIGVAKAKENKCSYLVFFDQDSSFDIGYIYKIYQEYKYIKGNGYMVGALGPTIIDLNDNDRKQYVGNRDKLYKDGNDPGYKLVDTIISSGSIIEMATFENVGLMDETLFIDLVDSEWCWRARYRGYCILITRNVELYHHIGTETRRFLFGAIIISKPFRYYYQYRNVVLLLNRKYVPLGWKLRIIVKKLYEMIYILFSLKEKRLIYKNIYNGIKDGIRLLV